MNDSTIFTDAMPYDSAESMLGPLRGDFRTGKNLEYDLRFSELSRLADGTREQQYGETVIAAQSPDMVAVWTLAQTLAEETRDLRVAVVAVEALTTLRGMVGLAEGLEVIADWTCELWPDVFPPLDEDDEDGGAFVRINALSRLDEFNRLPRIVAQVPLIDTASHATITVADLCGIGSDSVAGRASRVSAPEVEATFLAMPLSGLRELHQIADRSVAALQRTTAFIESAAGSGSWNPARLIGLATDCRDRLSQHLRKRISVADSLVTCTRATIDENETPPTAADGPPLRAGLPPDAVDDSIFELSQLKIESRDQASEVLEMVSQYFLSAEPSSPVPLLLRRARYLINRRFEEIIQDVAPEAIAEVRHLAGDDDAFED